MTYKPEKQKYILIITNTYDPHVDYVIRKQFAPREYPFIRFNTDEYPDLTSITASTGGDGTFRVFLKEIKDFVYESEIGSVWFRRPEPFLAKGVDERFKDFARQEMKQFVEGCWASLSHHKWINDPFAENKARHKVYQLKVAQETGFMIPPTCITTDPSTFLKFWDAWNGEVIYKVLGIPGSKTDGRTYFHPTHKLDKTFLNDIESIRIVPSMFQKYIPKKIELRVSVIEHEVFTCAIHSQESPESMIDWRLKGRDQPHTIYKLPKKLENKCIALVKRLGLRQGMIDMILTPDDEYIFLECNPNGQWVWVEQVTGLRISDAMFKALTSV